MASMAARHGLTLSLSGVSVEGMTIGSLVKAGRAWRSERWARQERQERRAKSARQIREIREGVRPGGTSGGDVGIGGGGDVSSSGSCGSSGSSVSSGSSGSGGSSGSSDSSGGRRDYVEDDMDAGLTEEGMVGAGAHYGAGAPFQPSSATVPKLRDELRRRGLSTLGRKTDLIERLVAAILVSSASGATAAPAAAVSTAAVSSAAVSTAAGAAVAVDACGAVQNGRLAPFTVEIAVRHGRQFKPLCPAGAPDTTTRLRVPPGRHAPQVLGSERLRPTR